MYVVVVVVAGETPVSVAKVIEFKSDPELEVKETSVHSACHFKLIYMLVYHESHQFCFAVYDMNVCKADIKLNHLHSVSH